VAKQFPSGRVGNRLLDLLPASEFDRLQPLLRKVQLQVKQVLYEARGEIEQLYFPINCALSAVTVMQDGHAIEVATVGNEGVSGLAGLTVVTRSPHRVFVQIAGEALKIDAKQLNRECKALPKLGETISKYQLAFLFQASQSVACNGLHVVIERCCRWLLMTHDRVPGDEVALTHEFLAIMLGVRRSGVTEVLQTLQQQGLIRYGHGKIMVLDREGLENLACECYECIQKEYHELLGA
jgi:CRP-like cAMP-binding protein